MKFMLVSVYRRMILVQGYEDIKKLCDNTKELVSICRQVLIANGDNVIYEFDCEKQEARRETKNVIMKKIEDGFSYRALTEKERHAIEML